MNKHTHQLVFNAARGCIMAVAETARSQGKANGRTVVPSACLAVLCATLKPLSFPLWSVLGLVAWLGAPAQAQIVADSLVDWIDADDQALPAGAEDDVYLSLPTPHRTGGDLLTDVSELKGVRGMDPRLYSRLPPTMPITCTPGEWILLIKKRRNFPGRAAVSRPISPVLPWPLRWMISWVKITSV